MNRACDHHQAGRDLINRISRRIVWCGLAGLALCLTGCGLFIPRPSPPKATMGSLQTVTNRPVGSVPLIVLRAEAMRFADDYAAIVAQAADDFASKVATPDARLAALKWKLHQATTAYTDPSGPHPTLNALDLVVLATVSRMVVEDYGVSQVFGEAALPLLETHRKLETNAWLLVNAVLTLEQRRELADMIQRWREENPHQRYLGGIRFAELAVALGQSMFQAKSKATSLFSLLYLDPLAGMDPTAAAVQEARYSAERAMYYAQRMSQLVSWQAELLASQLALSGLPGQGASAPVADRQASTGRTETTSRFLPVCKYLRASLMRWLPGLAESHRLLQDRRILAVEPPGFAAPPRWDICFASSIDLTEGRPGTGLKFPGRPARKGAGEGPTHG